MKPTEASSSESPELQLQDVTGASGYKTTVDSAESNNEFMLH